MKNLSESLKIIMAVLIIIILALFGVFMFQNVSGKGWYKNIKAEFTEQPNARTVTVTADGKVNVKPDLAMVDVGVTSAGKRVSDDKKDGNEKMNKIIDEMKKLGIDQKDLVTSQYNLYPQYDYSYYTGTSPKITGYNLSQTLSVKIRDLEKVDQVLDLALTNGANQVGSLSFDVDDKSKLRMEAREKAFKFAREKAESMASAVGVKIGRVVTFNENENAYPIQSVNFAYEAKVADQAVGNAAVESGSKDYSVSVSVTYEID